MEGYHKKKLLMAFVCGFLAAAVIIIFFVVSAKFIGIAFGMGFPPLLIETQPTSTGTSVIISWLIPFLVGLVFVLVETIRLI